MLGGMIDRIFGKRFRRGWPRGVVPMFLLFRAMAELDPGLWRKTEGLPLTEGLQIWREKYPCLFDDLAIDQTRGV